MRGWENIEAARRIPRVAEALGERPKRSQQKSQPATTAPESAGLAALWQQLWVYYGDMSGWRHEYPFHPERKWRFDLAHPGKKVAIEYDGMVGADGHEGWHRSWRGYQVDREKDCEAQLAGWIVLRVVRPMVVDGRALEYVLRAMEARRAP